MAQPQVEEEEQGDLIIRFSDYVKDFYAKVDEDVKKCSEDPTLKKKDLYIKYPHLKRGPKITKRSKNVAKALVKDMLDNEYTLYLREKHKITTKEQKDEIYKYCVKKIKGIYKHAQALKTGFCNLQIINGFSEPNTISICVTKNTLEANEQWLQRLFKELDNRYPQKKIKNKIMIISSKKEKNDLNGNAIHCDSIDSACKILKRENDIKIIFVCSNIIRISDILEISQDFLNLKQSLQKNLRILHDEAHNQSEGIPAFREIIENIILQPNVLSYTPITASNKTIIDETNPLWNQQNIEKMALNYTDYDDTKSDDPHYSSCSKAIQMTFERLKTMPEWRDYSIRKIPKRVWLKLYKEYYNLLTKFSEDDLKQKIQEKVKLFKQDRILSRLIGNIDEYIQDIDGYSKEELINKYKMIDMERRRQLEFCSFMKNDKEIEAVNNGLNMLNANIILGTDIFKKDELNIHIISTPRRNVITQYLCEVATKTHPSAIVLGIYGNEGQKYHLSYDNVSDMEVSHIMDNGQFNEKLNKIINYLKSINVHLNRPFIIIGNYFPTGESLTYVSYEYGTIRSNTRLISTNAEEDYQEGSRGNYMDAKFKEKNPEWVMPEKYLFGPAQFINNALSYELENDARIDSFRNSPPSSLNNGGNSDIQITQSEKQPSVGGNVAVPIKITINDPEHPDILQLIEIMNIKRKTDEDKIKFLKQLEKCKENPENICEMEDKTGKFDFQNQTLTNFRNYKKTEEGPKKGYWKFHNYQSHFKMETSFINSTGDVKENQCEILTCTDKYILLDENTGKPLEINHKGWWWMGYKY